MATETVAVDDALGNGPVPVPSKSRSMAWPTRSLTDCDPLAVRAWSRLAAWNDDRSGA